jgi:hypothetical protein
MKMSRRAFLGFAGALLATFDSLATEVPQVYADIAVTDRWIRNWMAALGSATGELHLGRFADRMYFLRKQIAWDPNPGQVAPSVKAAAGFVTDFASIPQIFWSTGLTPDALYTYPAILHDYLYWYQPCSRQEADNVLDFSMQEFNVPEGTRKLVYAGVRAGGWTAWNSNAKRKASGEKRLLRQLPTDPHITWAEWKSRPEVF